MADYLDDESQPDPVLQGWEALRAKRQPDVDREREAVRQRWMQPEVGPDPTVGTSPLARQLEAAGWFQRLEDQRALQNDAELRYATIDAVRRSQEAAEQTRASSSWVDRMRDVLDELGPPPPAASMA